MDAIGACKFYKKLIPCVPMNNKDSNGSSDSEDCCENVEKTSKAKKKVRKGCLVAIEDDSDSSDISETSEPRWHRNNVEDSNLVVPPSDHSSENMTAVSSTCISPMSNISSLVGSVTTLPPSPRTSSKNVAPRNKQVSKKPVVSVQDRYTQKKPEEGFETQRFNKNVVNVPCFPSKLPPVNPCRKTLFQGGSRPTITLQPRNKCTSSKRAKQLLEAASPRKPESSVRSAVNNPSPQKILAQRKRALKPTLNEESAKAMKSAIAASTPSITHPHSSNSSWSSIYSRNYNQFVCSDKSKKSTGAVSKKKDTGAVRLLEASSPRKPFSSANSVLNHPSPQNILAPRGRALQSSQTSSQNKENSSSCCQIAVVSSPISSTRVQIASPGLSPITPGAAALPCLKQTKDTPAKESGQQENDLQDNLQSISSHNCVSSPDIFKKTVSPILPENRERGARLEPLRETTLSATNQANIQSTTAKTSGSGVGCKSKPSQVSTSESTYTRKNPRRAARVDHVGCPSPSGPEKDKESENPIAIVNKKKEIPKKAQRKNPNLEPIGKVTNKTPSIQSKDTSVEESGQHEKDLQDNLQSTSPRTFVSSPDMFEETVPLIFPKNMERRKSAPQNARLGSLRGTLLSATDQAKTLSAAAKNNGSGVSRTSKPSQARKPRNTNIGKKLQEAARVDHVGCPSPSGPEKDKESENPVAIVNKKKEVPKKAQRKNPNLEPIGKVTNKTHSVQSKDTSAEESRQHEKDLQDNLQSASPRTFVSSPDMFEETVPLIAPENMEQGKSAPQNASLEPLRETALSTINQANIQSTSAKTSGSGVGRKSKASTPENTNSRKNPRRAAKVDRVYCVSPSVSETNNESEDDVVELEELEDHRQQEPKQKKNAKKNQNGTKQKKTKTNQGKGQKKSKKVLVDQEWHEADIPETLFLEEPEFTMPDDVKSPLEYFQYYFDDELIDMIVNQTNLYTTQQSGKSLCVTSDEILAFFGIMIYMGVCSLPAAEDYWALETRIPQVCQVMSRNRFQQIHAKIHFHNNEEEGDDKLLKIRPLLDHMRKKCHGVEQEYKVSVDERMQGYKGTRAGSLRQYLPDKPSSRFGFKLFVLAGKSGMTLDFIPYTGQDTFVSENLTDEEKALGVGAEAVISLCKSIRNPACTTVTIDNFYTGIPLLIYLRDKMNLKSVGTIKRSRTLRCPLTDGDQILTRGRGSVESFVNKDGIVVVQWADNKAVCLASSFVGVEPISTARRYSKEARAKIEVQCPRAVVKYNETMGGVDLADMFMGIYKIPTRARRYYFPFIGYSLELALTNSWLQYKRDCKLLKIPKKMVIDTSKKFRLEVSDGLKTRLLQSLGEPSLNLSLAKKKIKFPVVCRPNDSLRTDGYKHLPEYCNKGRCRYCTKGTSRFKCSKCEVVLCLNRDRNCFTQFHITKKGQLVPQDREEQVEEDEEEMDEEDLEEIDEEDLEWM